MKELEGVVDFYNDKLGKEYRYAFTFLNAFEILSRLQVYTIQLADKFTLLERLLLQKQQISEFKKIDPRLGFFRSLIAVASSIFITSYGSTQNKIMLGSDGLKSRSTFATSFGIYPTCLLLLNGFLSKRQPCIETLY